MPDCEDMCAIIQHIIPISMQFFHVYEIHGLVRYTDVKPVS